MDRPQAGTTRVPMLVRNATSAGYESRLFEQLAAAEDRLVLALIELHDAQANALLGEFYDSPSYDALIARYREAKAEVDAAREALQRVQRLPRDEKQHQQHDRPDGSDSGSDSGKRGDLHRSSVNPGVPTLASSSSVFGIEVTPRLRFARWLYDNGYIFG